MFLPEVKSKVGEDISILIKLDNYSFNIICECGEASELTVKDCQNTNALFISHTHIDHFINFDTILRHQIGGGNRVVICGPKGISKQVQSKIKAYQWNLIAEDAITYEVREIIDSDRIEVSELRPPIWDIVKTEERNKLYENKKFSVEFTILDHKTPSIAYLFKEYDSIKFEANKSAFKSGAWVSRLKNAYQAKDDLAAIMIENQSYQAKELYHLLEIKKGDTLGMIMDHAASASNHEKIAKLFQDCNKVYIECFYNYADRALAAANYHSYSKASGEIMSRCGVKTPIPIHFSRKYKEEEVSVLLAEFADAFKNAVLPQDKS